MRVCLCVYIVSIYEDGFRHADGGESVVIGGGGGVGGGGWA